MNRQMRSTSQDEIWSALCAVPADVRETWVKAAMAIKSELGDSGFSLWDGWSQTADNYSDVQPGMFGVLSRAVLSVLAPSFMLLKKTAGGRSQGRRSPYQRQRQHPQQIKRPRVSMPANCG